MKLSHLSAWLSASAFCCMLSACAKHQDDPRTRPELVRLVGATSINNGEHSFTGVVAARVQSDLGFRVPGKVMQRLVDVGQTVHQGQPLMTIDITDFKNTILSRQQEVAAARARAEEAIADEARYRGLVKTGAISASTYDQVKAAADSAKATLEAAQAQFAIAQDEGGYTTLLADANGVVVDTLAEPGQVVAAGQTVIKLAHAGPREALVNLPETVRPALGSYAQAVVYGSDGQVRARLRQLSQSADLRTRTFEARYVLEGKAAGAPLGATVSVAIPGASATESIAVPLSSLSERAGGQGVWVVQNDTVHFHPVRVVSLTAETALVTGLSPKDRIVALGAHLLHEGQLVRTEDGQVALR
jgi:RND family efflux transporter MFP subunit